MSQETINKGIDLGTTNSCITHWNGNEVEVIKSRDGLDYIPSAVWVDRRGLLHLGKKAKERFEEDPENVAIEFKLQMGLPTERVFQATGKRLRPEELSAEVLKELLRCARTRYSEEVEAAVITVPAAFDIDQCNATRQAAQLAGLVESPLLQEPVAGALAYGVNSNSDKVYWLVYDFGGGTFDAALVNLRDGTFRVVNHGGDNHLGGKLIDWEIVDQLFVPELLRSHRHRLNDFQRGNARWRRAFAKLKWQAEQAKIQLSSEPAISFSVEFADDKGETIEFDYEMKQKDLERLIDPFYQRALNICRRVLAEKNLGPESVEKVLLIGGPTLTPYLRQHLSDSREGLGIPLDFKLDPMTVVARGAAVFAATQRFKSKKAPVVSTRQFALELEYKPAGVDEDPLLGGTVLAPRGENAENYTLEFSDPQSRPPWRSGKLRLGANGKFMTNLHAERERQVIFTIELHDPKGRKCETVPDKLTYTVIGVEPGQQIMIHSVGVAQANNEVDVLIPKGTNLPARKKVVHRTVVAVRRGKAGELLRIPVVEGEISGRADRNREIGKLEIVAKDINRDVPIGSEVEITIEVDQSRVISTEAYIPILDQIFKEVIKLGKKAVDIQSLEQDVEQERERLQRVRQESHNLDDKKAIQVLDRIDRERMLQDVNSALAASTADPDAADKCQNRLLDLKVAIDAVEQSLEWPALLTEAEEKIREMREIVGKQGNANDQQNMTMLERETQRAMTARDPDLLRRKIKELTGLIIRSLQQQPDFWVAMLQYVESRRNSLDDVSLAEQLFSRARRAIAANDIGSLKSAVQQLVSLLPPDDQQRLTRSGGGTMRS